jgi:hypothetical protein
MARLIAHQALHRHSARGLPVMTRHTSVEETQRLSARDALRQPDGPTSRGLFPSVGCRLEIARQLRFLARKSISRLDTMMSPVMAAERMAVDRSAANDPALTVPARARVLIIPHGPAP